jgi:hypothetical protein
MDRLVEEVVLRRLLVIYLTLVVVVVVAVEVILLWLVVANKYVNSLPMDNAGMAVTAAFLMNYPAVVLARLTLAVVYHLEEEVLGNQILVHSQVVVVVIQVDLD